MAISTEKREKKGTFPSICGLAQFKMESNDNLNREEREKTNFLSDSKFDFVQNGVERQSTSRRERERKTNSPFDFELNSDRNEVELQSRSRTERKKKCFHEFALRFSSG